MPTSKTKIATTPPAVVHKQIAGLATKGDGLPKNTIRFTLTTDGIDRDGDVVDPAGGIFDEFLANPVFLYSHQFSSLPIGKVVKIGLAADRRSVWGDVQFAVEESEFAAQVYRLYKGGYLNAVSIGFRVIRSDPGDLAIRSRPDVDRQCKRHITKWLLLEVSAVAIPSNPEALRRAIDSGLVVSKALKASLLPDPKNPVDDAIGRIKKRLGWSDSTLSKLSVAEIRGVENLLSKSEPASTAEDDEVSPDAAKDTVMVLGKPFCKKCGARKPGCHCEHAARMKDRGRGPGQPPASTPAAATPGAPAKAVVLDAIQVKSVNDIIDDAVAQVRVQLPAVARGVIQGAVLATAAAVGQATRRRGI